MSGGQTVRCHRVFSIAAAHLEPGSQKEKKRHSSFSLFLFNNLCFVIVVCKWSQFSVKYFHCLVALYGCMPSRDKCYATVEMRRNCCVLVRLLYKRNSLNHKVVALMLWKMTFLTQKRPVSSLYLELLTRVSSRRVDLSSGHPKTDMFVTETSKKKRQSIPFHIMTKHPQNK